MNTHNQMMPGRRDGILAENSVMRNFFFVTNVLQSPLDNAVTRSSYRFSLHHNTSKNRQKISK